MSDEQKYAILGLNEYIRQGEPQKRERSEAWKVAIGLQQVDRLQTSEYLLDTAKRHIEGDISIIEAKQLIDSYYKSASGRKVIENDRTEEADKVAARITELIEEKTFSFTPAQMISIHRRLFDGIYKLAGRIRDYNITKNEWVLGGKTVYYASADTISETLNYDMGQEREFSYANMNIDDAIRHLTRFCANLWQVHAFCEGNTRTTAVFMIKYLRTLGFNVVNDVFAENSWYFRNALVRANYSDLTNGITETTEYLERFFRSMLLGEEHDLRNRIMHVDWNKVENETISQSAIHEVQSAKDDSAWRKVLEYFSSATQIGMTATPKADEGANNLDYFGEPVYTYSLLQGIQDGFLAPYRVTADFINVDLQGWTPEEGEIDLLGKEIEQKLYQRQNIGRDLAIKLRRKVVAHRITQMLHNIGRTTKTIVFCSDIEEAAEMRTLLINMNSDLCKKSPYYVTRIVGEDKEGKKQLDNFISVDEPYPVIVTTSELLSTGVDCKTCGLIVIDKEIGSMTEFKQIIGRGTRLRKDKGKWHLEILDFRNATAKFKDPAFDGDPEPPKGGGKKPKPYKIIDAPETPIVSEPREKYLISGKNICIAHEIVSVLGEDGKTMRTESVQSFAKKQLLRHYQTLDDFIQTWMEAERKQAIMDELKEYAILIDAVREANPALKDADIFDVICHVAFDQPPLTRKERANNVKKRNYFGKYEGKAREVLEALLDKYAENGILDFEKANILEIPPFNSIGKPTKIIKLFGGKVAFEQAIRELEYQIYKSA